MLRPAWLFGHRQRNRVGVHRALDVADLAAILVTVHGGTYAWREGGLVIVGASGIRPCAAGAGAVLPLVAESAAGSHYLEGGSRPYRCAGGLGLGGNGGGGECLRRSAKHDYLHGIRRYNGTGIIVICCHKRHTAVGCVSKGQNACVGIIAAAAGSKCFGIKDAPPAPLTRDRFSIPTS